MAPLPALATHNAPPSNGVTPSPSVMETGRMQTASLVERKNPNELTYNSINSSAEVRPIDALDMDTRKWVVQHFSAYCQEMQAKRDRGDATYFADRTNDLALAVWEKRKDGFFKLPPEPKAVVPQETKPTHGEEKKDEHEKSKPSAGKKPEDFDLVGPDGKPVKLELKKSSPESNFSFEGANFTSEELVIVEGVLRKIAHQEAAALGVELTAVNSYLPVGGETEKPLTPSRGLRWFMSQFKEKVGNYDLLSKDGKKLIVRDKIDLNKLIEGNYVKKLEGAVPSSYPEAREFTDPQIFTQDARIQELVDAHNASIAFREAITHIPCRDARFGQDRLSTKMRTQEKLLLETIYNGAKKEQLTNVQQAELRELSLNSALAEIGRNTAKGILENRKTEIYTREDHLALAKQKADEKRGQPVTKKEYSQKNPADGSVTSISFTEYNNLDTARKAKKTEVDNQQKIILKVEKDKERLKELQEKYQSDKEESYERTLIVNSWVHKITHPDPAVANADIARYQAKLDAETISTKTESLDSNGKKVITTETRNLTPDEKENRMGSLMDVQKAARIKLKEIDDRIAEYNALLADEPNFATRQTAAEQAKRQAEEDLKNMAEPQERDVVTSQQPEIVRQVDFLLGADNPQNDFKAKLTHVGEVFYKPQDRRRALESWDTFKNTLFGVETDIEGQKMAAQLCPTREVMLNGLSQYFGLSIEDLDRLGFGEKRPDGKYILIDEDTGLLNWNEIQLRTTTGTHRDDIRQNVVRLESIMLEYLQNLPADQVAEAGMAILAERLQAAAKGTLDTFTSVEIPGKLLLRKQIVPSPVPTATPPNPAQYLTTAVPPNPAPTP